MLVSFVIIFGLIYVFEDERDQRDDLLFFEIKKNKGKILNKRYLKIRL